MVFRTDEPDGRRLVELLRDRQVAVSVERYARDAINVLASSDRPDLAVLARTAGRSIRQIVSLDDLNAR